MRRKGPAEIKKAAAEGEPKQKPHVSPTVASGRPKRRAAERSPSFRYDKEVADKFDASASSRPSSSSQSVTPPLIRSKQSKTAEKKTANLTKSAEVQSSLKRSKSKTTIEKDVTKETSKIETESKEVDQSKLSPISKRTTRKSEEAVHKQAVSGRSTVEPDRNDQTETEIVTQEDTQKRITRKSEIGKNESPLAEKEKTQSKSAQKRRRSEKPVDKTVDTTGDSAQLVDTVAPVEVVKSPEEPKKRSRSKPAVEKAATSNVSEANPKRKIKESENAKTPQTDVKSSEQQVPNKGGRSKKVVKEPSEDSAEEIVQPRANRSTRKAGVDLPTSSTEKNVPEPNVGEQLKVNRVTRGSPVGVDKPISGKKEIPAKDAEDTGGKQVETEKQSVTTIAESTAHPQELPSKNVDNRSPFAEQASRSKKVSSPISDVPASKGKHKETVASVRAVEEPNLPPLELNEEPDIQKNQPSPLNKLSNKEPSDETSCVQNAEELVSPRKRGRPKKSIVEEPSPLVVSGDKQPEELISPKRKAGRPRLTEEEKFERQKAKVVQSKINDSEDELVDDHTQEELEVLFEKNGFLTCSRCKSNYKSTVFYFMKHWRSCTGERRTPGRKSKKSDTSEDEGDESSEESDIVTAEFPPPQSDVCKLCPPDTASFDDIFRHYATAHYSLYDPESPEGYRRDAPALDQILSLVGHLKCQYCPRKFNKCGFGLIIHESRCPSSTRRSMFESSICDTANVEGVDSSELIDGRTMAQLEALHNRNGLLKCSKCEKEYRSPVAYFVQHVAVCGRVGDEESNSNADFDAKIDKFPQTLVPGTCIFCPADRPPVEDMNRHYAIEHCVLYIDKEPGWCRSAEALDVVLRLTGKLTCQFCQKIFKKSGNGLIIHESHCSARPISPKKKVTSEVVSEVTSVEFDFDGESSFTVDGLSEKNLTEMKNRDGYLTCPRCKATYRSTVDYFIKHFHSCTGHARKIPANMLELLANGERCGDPPFECQLCNHVTQFEHAYLLQNHYMHAHVALYAPDFPEGIRTGKAREIILKKIGSLVCPKCNSSYKVVGSFLYHEKVCFAGDKTLNILVPSIAKKVDKEILDPVKCTICPDGKTLEPAAVQTHYMDTHCAIYDPESGNEKCILDETNEVFEFIMQRIGFMRCDRCNNKYRSPPWYFKRHRETCGVESQTETGKSQSSGESDTERQTSGKKNRRQAASRALKRIGRMAVVTASQEDENSKEEKSSESDVKSFTVEEETTTSSGETEDENESGVEESESVADQSVNKGTPIRFNGVYVRNIRDWPLRKVVSEMNNKFRRRFAPLPDGRPVALPARLLKVKPEFHLWTAEKTEEYLKTNGAVLSFRFEDDPPQQKHVITSFAGKTSEGQSETTFFAGGRIYAIDSAPLRQNGGATNVFFAVSAASCQDPDTRISTQQPSAIQIWHVPVEINTNNEPRLKSPRLAYSLAIDDGPVFALQFCPIAPEDEKNGIGLLAIGGNAPNLISIVALPSLDEVAMSEGGKNFNNPSVFRPTIGLQLKIHSSTDSGSSNEGSSSPDIGSESSVYPRRTICMDWSQDGEVLVAALNDATIALWKFESFSPLFSLGGSYSSLLAARVFRAHSQPLVAVRITPFSKIAIVTLSIDGALSLFSAANGNLLNSIMSPYSTHLSLMSGSSIPILVNNPWFVFRRVQGETVKKEGSSPTKGAPVISTLSAVDLFGDSPASDTYPFRPITSGGSISCISTIKPMLPPCGDGVEKSIIALGFVVGTNSGDVTLYTTTSHLLKIRLRGVISQLDCSEKLVCSSRLLNTNNLIELGSSRHDEQTERSDPIAAAVAPPAINAVNLVTAIQFPSEMTGCRSTTPRVVIASAMTCGLVRISFDSCASMSQVSVKKKPFSRKVKGSEV